MLEYIQQHEELQDRISGYWKGHSTATILVRIKDDITKAMKKGEVSQKQIKLLIASITELC